jgi:hypothetical protein
MDAPRPPQGSVNDRYAERLARKDWLRNVQTAYFEQRVALRHARIKSHYVRYFDVTARHVHFIEHLARLAVSPTAAASAEALLAERLDRSMRTLDEETARAQALMEAEGIAATPAYLQAPLALTVRCTSPRMSRYLELVLKADRVFALLEALRLAGVIATEAYNYRCAFVVRRLVIVARTASRTVVQLRKQAQARSGAPAAAASPVATRPLALPTTPTDTDPAAAPAPADSPPA